jgi:predicted SAM-dependent methyltransferase
MKKLLNIGCGVIFHKDWENVDILSTSPHIRQHDITKGLPYPDNTFEACYASHVLEHIKSEDVNAFMRECLRVLKPEGFLRFVVPDFEKIANLYLEALANTLNNNDEESIARHDWLVIETFDQMIRYRSGGMMKQFIISNKDKPIVNFIRTRIGAEADGILLNDKVQQSFVARLLGKKISWYRRKLSEKTIEFLAYVLLGKNGMMSVREGFFKNSGEIHRWAYDRVSLKLLLSKHGCVNIVVQDAFTSNIPCFCEYQLDAIDGFARKPDSIYIEGTKS